MTDAGAERLDRAAIDRLLDLGGEKLLAGMIDLFLEHYPVRIEAARLGAAAGEHDVVRRAAHSLKSTAGNLGATTLQLLAARIETLAASEDTAYDALIGAFEEEFHAVRGLLEREREGLGT